MNLKQKWQLTILLIYVLSVYITIIQLLFFNKQVQVGTLPIYSQRSQLEVLLVTLLRSALYSRRVTYLAFKHLDSHGN